MKFDDVEAAGVLIYGDRSYRGKCPPESVEQVSFFSWLRREYPNCIGALALHPRNEGQLRGGQFRTVTRARAEGMTKGAADIIIPGSPAFVCEMKRRDHTKSAWQEGQVEYLSSSARAGCFTCVALGYEGARDAIRDWIVLMGCRGRS